MSGRTVTVNEVMDGHVVLDIECLDRIYLNAYVPILQSSGQVVAFMTQYLDMPIPSPALLEKKGTAFRAAVASFADANHIPVVRFRKEDRKAEVMAPYLRGQAATGRSGVRGDRGVPGVPAGLGRLPARDEDRRAAVHVHESGIRKISATGGCATSVKQMTTCSGSPGPRPGPRKSRPAWPGSCATSSSWSSTRRKR